MSVLRLPGGGWAATQWPPVRFDDRAVEMLVMRLEAIPDMANVPVMAGLLRYLIAQARKPPAPVPDIVKLSKEDYRRFTSTAA